MDVKDAIETRRAYRSLEPLEITEELIMNTHINVQLYKLKVVDIILLALLRWVMVT